MQTERVTFLTSPAVKRTIVARANDRGLSVGEFVRRKALDDDDLTPKEEAELGALVAEAKAAIPAMQAALDRMNERLERMNQKNEAFLKQMGIAI